jgi:hypothetical protein
MWEMVAECDRMSECFAVWESWQEENFTLEQYVITGDGAEGVFVRIMPDEEAS